MQWSLCEPWINLKVNDNHEITTQKQKQNVVLPSRDFKHGPLELKPVCATKELRWPLQVMLKTIETHFLQKKQTYFLFRFSSLDKDFQELQSKFGYDYIELQLDFSMDLYPFFPPLVKVIRPRLQGSMMLRVTTMEILKLSYWNPARDMKSVLVRIIYSIS